MKMNKKAVMAVSLVVGAIMLTTSAFANFVNSSGYDNCKNSLKKMIGDRNHTLDMRYEMFVDDTSIGLATYKELLNLDSDDSKLNLVYTTENQDYRRQENTYFQDGERISKTTYEDLTGENDTSEYYHGREYYIDDLDPNVGYLFEINDAEDEKTVEKIVRFAELGCDLIVGDLKNNVILVDSDDEKDTYAIDLTSYQIPEIVSAGMSLIFAEGNSYYMENKPADVDEMMRDEPLALLGTDPVIDGGKATVTIDSEGRMLNIYGELSVSGTDPFGNDHTFKMVVDINGSDYGTTVPERIDITGKAVERASKWRENRVKNIEDMLAVDDLDSETREDLQDELEELKQTLEDIANGNMDEGTDEKAVETTEVTENPDGSVEVKIADDANSSSIGIIGGSDGPTTVYISD